MSDRDLPKFAHIPTKHPHSRNRVASNGPAWWLTVSWSSDRRIALVSFITPQTMDSGLQSKLNFSDFRSDDRLTGYPF